jgi:chromosome transmission fidelity protein 18
LTKGSKKGRKGLPPLARPLICIANDLYAPALRPLREVAEIFQFKVCMFKAFKV